MNPTYESFKISAHGYDFTVLDRKESRTPEFVQLDLQKPSLLNALRKHTGGDGSGLTFIDVGANIGMWSLLARKMFHGARILAVEPITDTRALLQVNTSGTGVSIDGRAISNIRSIVDLGWHPLNPGMASFQHAHIMPETERVETIPLLDFMDENEVVVADFVKMDIEGMEYRTLYGVSDWSRIKMLFVELHGIASWPEEINRAVFDEATRFLKRIHDEYGVIIEAVRGGAIKPIFLLDDWNPSTRSHLFAPVSFPRP